MVRLTLITTAERLVNDANTNWPVWHLVLMAHSSYVLCTILAVLLSSALFYSTVV